MNLFHPWVQIFLTHLSHRNETERQTTLKHNASSYSQHRGLTKHQNGITAPQQASFSPTEMIKLTPQNQRDYLGFNIRTQQIKTDIYQFVKNACENKKAAVSEESHFKEAWLKNFLKNSAVKPLITSLSDEVKTWSCCNAAAFRTFACDTEVKIKQNTHQCTSTKTDFFFFSLFCKR